MKNNFSSKERKIARFLSTMPFLKNSVKRIYQYVVYFLSREKFVFKSDYQVSEVEIGDEETFFGYYDKSPLSANEQFLLCHSTCHRTRYSPSDNKSINVNVIDFKTGENIWSYPTSAYNWQQGARLQWLTENKVIFNVFSAEDRVFKSVIYDIASHELQEILFPVYDCFNEEFALSVNFSRLHTLSSDYGYRNLGRLSDKDLHSLDSDGIFFVDLLKNSSELFVSFKDILDIEYEENMKNASHTVNHLMISPNGGFTIFIHRYFVKNNQRQDRLMLLNLENREMRVLAKNEMVSHCTWFGENKIVGYFRNDEGEDTYHMIDLTNNQINDLNYEFFASLGDGHPSMDIKSMNMLYDTYPNKARMKTLGLYNILNKKNKGLGLFYEPLRFSGESRCDLHPRFSNNGRYVFFDSVHTGKRKLYWIEI